MTEAKKIYYNAEDVAQMLGVSVGHSYKIIKRLNDELKENGFLTVAGKVPIRYFEKRCYGFAWKIR